MNRASVSKWFRESTLVRIVAGFALAAGILALLGWAITGPLRGTAAGFDSSIRTTIRQLQSPLWTAFFLALTKLGSGLYLWIIGAAAGLIFIMLRWFRTLFLFILLMAGQAALHHGFKWIFARPRPSALINYRTVESFSFPSGHAVAALCLYGALAWIVASRIDSSAPKAGIAISTVIVVFLIGFSRVYIGVHHPTDVLAGFLAASVWLLAVMSTDRNPL